eukprot:TRINITY_DN1022_c0_g2_i1.p1 TRINITY_DN1022_c0_g2~~TRINITY_DN1022_c0_g2_i1.p1  ORF type:complete len:684 (-),score=201.47 TRINITY_DN1022_c0_g2_i1:1258-3309(-)
MSEDSSGGTTSSKIPIKSILGIATLLGLGLYFYFRRKNLIHEDLSDGDQEEDGVALSPESEDGLRECVSKHGSSVVVEGEDDASRIDGDVLDARGDDLRLDDFVMVEDDGTLIDGDGMLEDDAVVDCTDDAGVVDEDMNTLDVELETVHLVDDELEDEELLVIDNLVEGFDSVAMIDDFDDVLEEAYLEEYDDESYENAVNEGKIDTDTIKDEDKSQESISQVQEISVKPIYQENKSDVVQNLNVVRVSNQNNQPESIVPVGGVKNGLDKVFYIDEDDQIIDDTITKKDKGLEKSANTLENMVSKIEKIDIEHLSYEELVDLMSSQEYDVRPIIIEKIRNISNDDWKANLTNGLHVWRIEESGPVAWPVGDYGIFYNGDTFVVLNKTDEGSDLHLWIGSKSTLEENSVGSKKVLELDYFLGDEPIQHREEEGSTSEQFLSYFKRYGGFHVLEGGHQFGSTPLNHFERDKFKPKLLRCKGNREKVQVKQVPYEISSLNSGDVFILVTYDTIFQFNGANAGIFEKRKGSHFVSQIREQRARQGLTGDIWTVDEASPSEHDQLFWDFFGGKQPIPAEDEAQDEEIDINFKLFRLSDDTGVLSFEFIAADRPLDRRLLKSEDVFIIDAQHSIYVWIGSASSAKEKGNAMTFAHRYCDQYHNGMTFAISIFQEKGVTNDQYDLILGNQ